MPQEEVQFDPSPKILYFSESSEAAKDFDFEIAERLAREWPDSEIVFAYARGRARDFAAAGFKAVRLKNEYFEAYESCIEDLQPDFIVTHAGLESVSAAARAGRPPIVIADALPAPEDPGAHVLGEADRVVYFGEHSETQELPWLKSILSQIDPVRAESARAQVADRVVESLVDRRPFHAYRPQVVVKLRDMGLPYVDAVETRLHPADADLLSRLGKFSLRRLFRSLDPEKIRQKVAEAVRLDPDYRPPQFLTYYRTFVPPQFDSPRDFVRSLNDLWFVERAYPQPIEEEPVTPNDENRYGSQGYLGSSGINVEAVWNVHTGADGQGQGFGDVEADWGLFHEDLSRFPLPITGPFPTGSSIPLSETVHGTQTLGVVCSLDNGVGCIGIVPQVSSVFLASRRDRSTSDAILAAVEVLGYGDVLLVEVQERIERTIPLPHDKYWPKMPVEAIHDGLLAIRLATALGITVIEPAGNGYVDLASYAEPGQPVLVPGAAGFVDSGAVIVGAVNPPGVSGAGYRRESSNYGARVDCHAWGSSVVTPTWLESCPRRDADPANDCRSYSIYTGTSSAAAIIAGAALSVQGMAEYNLGFRLSPRQMRSILSDPLTGSLALDHATEPIGVMPDLGQVVASTSFSLASDLYLRDAIGDTGDGVSGSISSSPDIFIQDSSAHDPALDDPVTMFAAGSPGENSVLPAIVAAATDHWVYVRVKNRGASAAENVTATVYWSEVSLLPDPDDWVKIGVIDQWRHPAASPLPTTSIPGGDVLTVAQPLQWASADAPPPGHYCFVALLGSPQEPAPEPIHFTDFGHYVRFVRENNNVAWRNFNVVSNVPPPRSPGPPGVGGAGVGLPFLAAGAWDLPRKMRIEVVAKLPKGAQLWLDVPPQLAEALGGLVGLPKPGTKGRVWIPMNPYGLKVVCDLVFPKKVRFALKLWVRVPPALRHNAYQISARQLFEGREVGSVTWVLAPPE